MSSDPPTTERLHDEFRTHATRAFRFEEPPETFGELWTRMMTTFAEGLERGVTMDDLCTTDRSPHYATVNGETEYYRCVTDGFILGSVLDDPVTVRTESPVAGTEIVVEFDEHGVLSVPDGAHLSFGVHRSVRPPDGPITPEKMYGRFCPYSKAFASRAEYDQWAESHPDVVTDVQPLGDALELQARLLGSASPGDGEGHTPGTSEDGGCSC